MQFISDWVVNIVVFILLAMVVDMLLPETSIKKYVKLVTGLLLITIVITPIFRLLSTDIEEFIDSISVSERSMETPLQRETEEKKREIETSTHAYILEQMAVQLKESAEKEMIERYGMAISNIRIAGDVSSTELLDSIQKITVYIKPESEDNEVAAVKPVSIHLNKKKGEINKPDYQGIQTLLASQWDLPESKIEIADEGRNR